MAQQGQSQRHACGMTLIEVLIAFFILFVVTLAILQLFSLALAINMGSAARTELSYKCQQVAEVVRLQSYYARLATPTNSACCPLTDGTYPIPTPPSGTCTDSTLFWGSAGANVLDANARYALSYTIAAGGIGHIVTVTAQPTTTGSQYMGAGISRKTVSYVAEIP